MSEFLTKTLHYCVFFLSYLGKRNQEQVRLMSVLDIHFPLLSVCSLFHLQKLLLACTILPFQFVFIVQLQLSIYCPIENRLDKPLLCDFLIQIQNIFKNLIATHCSVLTFLFTLRYTNYMMQTNFGSDSCRYSCTSCFIESHNP